MKKTIIILLLTLTTKLSFSQESFFFEPINQDTVKFFFDKIGDITTSDKMSFYRVGKMNNNYFSFDGEIKDYSKDNELLFIGHYHNGVLNGIVKIYDKGTLKEIGNYKNGTQDSIWTYYRNNHVVKKVDFSNNQFRLCEYYSEKGKSQIVNGICIYKDIIINYKSTDELIVKGKFKNGLLNGKLTCGVYSENYEDGKFIKGNCFPSGIEYFVGSRITLISFNPHEYTNLYYNFVSLKKSINCSSTSSPLKFHGDQKLDSTFFKILKDSVLKLYENENQRIWYLIDLGITKESKIDYVKIFSPQKNNKSDQIKSIINDFSNWETYRCGNYAYSCRIYFPIIIENSVIEIPEYTGFYHSEIASIFIKTIQHLNESKGIIENKNK